eukprot:TRINITY_DN875_c0_g1_i2.p1 TRINITY_DN875_c0_g1~~TRINITY_DN875_c0_g1_i2.p1  ORF type:complete len:810 (+),score=184.88 TRINITY_DN875_c0_g1_i2:186-2615(+)
MLLEALLLPLPALLAARGAARDGMHAIFLAALIATHVLEAGSAYLSWLLPGAVLSRCVPPLVALANRCVYLRKPPTQVELGAYVLGFVLLPALTPTPAAGGTLSYIVCGITQLSLMVGYAYPQVSTSCPLARTSLPQPAALMQAVPVCLYPLLCMVMPSLSSYGLLMVAGAMFAEPLVFVIPRAGAAHSPVKRGKKEQMTQDMFRNSKLPEEEIDAIVIGSGIGGLATAALMSRIQGKRVLVLEKHYRSGGCTHIFDEYGDLFDSGIHYLGAPAALNTMMSLIGDGSFNLVPIGSEADNFLYDQFDLGTEVNGKQFVEYRATRSGVFDELKRHFPDQVDGIDVYDAKLKKLSWATYSYVAWSIISGMVKQIAGAHLLKFFKSYTDVTGLEAVRSCGITDEKLIAILTGGQLIDWNVAPDEVSFFVSGAMLNYYDDGGFYPEGGSDKIAEAIIPVIEQAGGRVLTQVEVKEIIVEDGVASGVLTDKAGLIKAPLIISNAGAINTFEKLLSPKISQQFNIPKIDFKPGRSHMTAFVSLDGVYTDFDLRPSNIHSFIGLPEFEYDVSKMERALFETPDTMSRKALITLTCPSAKDPLYQHRYPGCSNVLLLAEADWSWMDKFDPTVKSGSDGREAEYKDFCKQWEGAFLERLYRYYPKCEGKVKQIHIGTPLTNHYYLNSPQGASYGLDWDVERFKESTLEALRTQTKVPNLWSTGTDNLFGGFAGAMMSGVVTFLQMSGFQEHVLATLAAILLSWFAAFILNWFGTGLIWAVFAQIFAIVSIAVVWALLIGQMVFAPQYAAKAMLLDKKTV